MWLNWTVSIIFFYPDGIAGILLSLSFCSWYFPFTRIAASSWRFSIHSPYCITTCTPKPEPSTEIIGAPDLYIESGSTINLTCVIEDSPEPPAYIFWNHNNAVSIQWDFIHTLFDAQFIRIFISKMLAIYKITFWGCTFVFYWFLFEGRIVVKFVYRE